MKAISKSITLRFNDKPSRVDFSLAVDCVEQALKEMGVDVHFSYGESEGNTLLTITYNKDD